MNGSILVFFIIISRYGVLRLINKDALKRVDFFPPLIGKERIAFWIYEVFILMMLIYLFFLDIKLESLINFVGLVLTILGLILYTVSIIQFAKPKKNGINVNGIYKISRNPMYVSFFLYFLGAGMLTNSYLLILMLIVFQIANHYLILSEERWCVEQFGNEYLDYMRNVRRYI